MWNETKLDRAKLWLRNDTNNNYSQTKWLATQAGKTEPSCPLGTTRCIPQEQYKFFID